MVFGNLSYRHPRSHYLLIECVTTIPNVKLKTSVALPRIDSEEPRIALGELRTYQGAVFIMFITIHTAHNEYSIPYQEVLFSLQAEIVLNRMVSGFLYFEVSNTGYVRSEQRVLSESCDCIYGGTIQTRFFPRASTQCIVIFP